MPLMQLQEVAASGRLFPFTESVWSGEILHLVGPNGAGKSTLLARMAGMSSGAGEINFNGQPLEDISPAALAHHRAWLPQQQTPPFAMPVWHYLSLHQRTQDSVLLHAVAAQLCLEDKLTRGAHQLSGGEWQRVRLAAVILQIHPQGNPDGQLLLLDEPMNSLDVAQQAALDRLLHELCAAGITVVMSSHDLNHSLRHAQRIWLLQSGKLIASGPQEKVLTTANLAVAYGIDFHRVDVDGYSLLLSAH